jgi:hypothetical protein
VILDLLRVLPVAVLVGVVPGYLLARCLCSSTDHLERMAFGAALSMALVPAVALVPARVFGTGVTFAVAALSVAAVFLAGCVAYLAFGPAGESEKPVASVPGVLDLPALAPLAGALVIALGAEASMFGSWSMVPAALLAALSGALHLVRSRRKPEPDVELPEKTPGLLQIPAARRLTMLGIFSVVFFRGYSGPALHDWPFIRGVDHYSHTVMANLMMAEGSIHPYLIYPPGFHTMIAGISHLSGLGPLEVFPVLGPALLLLPALSLYVLGRRLWGWEAGSAAAGFSVLVGGTYYYYNDAMYPNLVTSQFLLPMALAALVMLYSSPSVRTGLLFAILGSSVVLYHQVASMYLALLLALVGAYLLPYLLLRERRRGIALLSSVALLGTLAVLYAWTTYDLPGMVMGLVGGDGGGDTGDAVDMALGTQAAYSYSLLTWTMVSHPVTWLGLLGAFLLFASGAGRRAGVPPALAHLTVLMWALLLFVGSRATMTGFPQRFGRDLGLPLALLAALAFVVVLRSLKPRETAAVFATSLTAILAVTLVGLHAVENLESAAGPSVQLTITPGIAAAGEWLEEHNEGGNIMVSPHGNQVPSRMMLAMGGYSAMQSFEEKQLRNPRDLPPGGAGPLWDVQRVIKHPAGERAGRLLEKHDVRYVVLYKDMPDRAVFPRFWPVFKQHPDLYQIAFENEDVLIVEPLKKARRTS